MTHAHSFRTYWPLHHIKAKSSSFQHLFLKNILYNFDMYQCTTPIGPLCCCLHGVSQLLYLKDSPEALKLSVSVDLRLEVVKIDQQDSLLVSGISIFLVLDLLWNGAREAAIKVSPKPSLFPTPYSLSQGTFSFHSEFQSLGHVMQCASE